MISFSKSNAGWIDGWKRNQTSIYYEGVKIGDIFGDQIKGSDRLLYTIVCRGKTIPGLRTLSEAKNLIRERIK